ncbi:MAG: Ig-like domain-containing protein [Clostridia bacterium]|nr:Ig-like domain-containing protein [Clostridia bacterium]
MIDFKQIIPFHYMECNPKRKRFVRLGCAALAVALAVGSVSFLRVWAAEDDAAVSGSDIVTQSYMTNETAFVSSSDAASTAEENEAKADNDGAVVLSETVAPKYRASSVFNWVKANSVTDFNNAAHGSNSRISYYSGVTNWLHSSGQAFAEAQGLDYRKCYFLTSWDGSRFIAAYKDQPSSVVTTGYKNASEFETLVNNGVTFFYVPYTETEDISFAETVYEVNVDETISICPTFTPAWSNDLVTWESSDPTVASVVYRPSDIRKADGSCQVTGISAGITTLTATVNGHTVTCQVAVSGAPYTDLSNIDNWTRATTGEELANARTFGEDYMVDWYDEWYEANKSKRIKIDGKFFRASQILFIQSYIPNSSNPDYDEISYFSSGNSYPRTNTVSNFNLTNTCIMYMPKSDLSFTYHAAVEPTCTEAGSIAYWTDQYGNKFADANTETPLTDEEIPLAATGHTWGNWTEITAPSCETAGEETRVCANDANHTETREIAAIGHDWGSWTTTTPATCETPGEKTRTCKNDSNHTETEEIPALRHDWGEWTETTAPSCETAGEETRVCQNDPSHTETREVTALGHNWEWVTDTEATYEEAGEKHEECSVCHAKQKEHTAIPVKNAPVLEPVSGDHSQYTVGSQDGVTMKIDRMDTDDADIYQHFLDAGSVVKVTGGNGYEKTLDSGDFEASEGSLVITLTASYLSTLAPGEYKLTATFLIDETAFESAPVTFTVAASGGTGDSPATDTPATGESIALISVSLALMMLAAYGVVYAFRRRRALGE